MYANDEVFVVVGKMGAEQKSLGKMRVKLMNEMSRTHYATSQFHTSTFTNQ